MKKFVVGIMLAVFMAMMLVPAFGDSDEIMVNEIYTIENTIVETELNEKEISGNEEEVDDVCYIVKFGGHKIITIEKIRTPKFIEKIGDGFEWIGDKCKDGFDAVKNLFDRPKG